MNGSFGWTITLTFVVIWQNKSPNVSRVHQRNQYMLRICEGQTTRLWNRWGRTVGDWAQTRRICSHKSPIIPLLLPTEKQLLPISKRVKNASVNEQAHVHVCMDSCLERYCTPAVFCFLIPNMSSRIRRSSRALSYLHVSACFVSVSHFDTHSDSWMNESYLDLLCL